MLLTVPGETRVYTESQCGVLKWYRRDLSSSPRSAMRVENNDACFVVLRGCDVGHRL